MAKKKKKNPNSSVKRSKTKKVKSTRDLFAKLQYSLYPDIDWRKTFYITFAIISLLTVTLAVNSGVNGDDDFQNAYADSILDYYTTFGSDTTCFYHPRGPIQFYGGIFELPAAIVTSTFGLDRYDIAYHGVRHSLNALFGLLAIFFIGYCTKEIANWRAAVIAITLAFLSPRFLGHSLMNPKDIPFAAGYIMAIYYMLKFIQQSPNFNRKTMIGLAIAIGICFGSRSGGLLLIAYLGLFVGLAFLIKHGVQSLANFGLFGKYLKNALIPVVIGISIGILVWPYALSDPIHHIPESLSAFTNFSYGIRMLFNGEMIFGNQIGNAYLPTWMLISIPLSVMLGFLGLVFTFRGVQKTYSPFYIFVIAFTFLFPIFYILIKNSTLYDGWRHLTFTYTSLVILAALGFEYLIHKFFTKKILLYGILAVMGLSMLEPMIFIIKNYSYPYVYFNPVIGGIQGAFGKYETDYWGVSVKQAVEKMKKEGLLGDNMTDTVTITSNFSYALAVYTRKKFGGMVKSKYIRYRERYNSDWDYGIFLSRFIPGTRLLAEQWPPKENTLLKVSANGVPLAAISDGREKAIFQGVQAVNRQDFAPGIQLLEPLEEQFSDDEIYWGSLATAYMNTGNYSQAELAFKKSLAVEKENIQYANMLGLCYLQQSKLQESYDWFASTLEWEPQNATAYFYMANIQLQSGNLQAALNNALQSIQVNPGFRQAYNLTATIYERMGDTQNAQRYRNAIR